MIFIDFDKSIYSAIFFFFFVYLEDLSTNPIFKLELLRITQFAHEFLNNFTV